MTVRVGLYVKVECTMHADRRVKDRFETYGALGGCVCKEPAQRPSGPTADAADATGVTGVIEATGARPRRSFIGVDERMERSTAVSQVGVDVLSLVVLGDLRHGLVLLCVSRPKGLQLRREKVLAQDLPELLHLPLVLVILAPQRVKLVIAILA